MLLLILSGFGTRPIPVLERCGTAFKDVVALRAMAQILIRDPDAQVKRLFNWISPSLILKQTTRGCRGYHRAKSMSWLFASPWTVACPGAPRHGDTTDGGWDNPLTVPHLHLLAHIHSKSVFTLIFPISFLFCLSTFPTPTYMHPTRAMCGRPHCSKAL